MPAKKTTSVQAIHRSDTTPLGAGDSAAWFRRVKSFSALAGLCPLIPIPFLDDKVLSWVRGRSWKSTSRAPWRGIALRVKGPLSRIGRQ